MKVKMPLLGLTVPQQRAILKTGYSFSRLPFEEQLLLWDHVWHHARTHEAKMQAGLFVEKPPKGTDLAWLWGALSPWATSINCWDQSDTLSKVYSQINERLPDLVVPSLRGME